MKRPSFYLGNSNIRIQSGGKFVYRRFTPNITKGYNIYFF